MNVCLCVCVSADCLIEKTAAVFFQHDTGADVTVGQRFIVIFLQVQVTSEFSYVATNTQSSDDGKLEHADVCHQFTHRIAQIFCFFFLFFCVNFDLHISATVAIRQFWP